MCCQLLCVHHSFKEATITNGIQHICTVSHRRRFVRHSVGTNFQHCLLGKQVYHWRLLVFSLLIYNLFTWLCHGLSFFTLLFISIERYFAVFHPFWYKESVTKTRIFCAIVTTWVICGALVIILNFMPSIPHSVRTVVMTCLFLPSILSTVVIYLKIFREIRGNTAQVGPSVHGSPAETQVRKSSKTVGVIIGVQSMSFFPCICLNIVQMLSFVPSVLLIHGIFPFAEAAAFMNAVLDPMIYFWRNKEARGSLVELRHINICMKSKTDVSLSQTENSTVVIQLKDYGSG